MAISSIPKVGNAGLHGLTFAAARPNADARRNLGATEMSMRRVYKLAAAPGRADELLAALRVLAGQLAPLAGNEGVEVWADIDNPLAFTFVEHWLSVEAQKAAGAVLGKAAFAGIAPTLGAPPESASLMVIDQWPIGAG